MVSVDMIEIYDALVEIRDVARALSTDNGFAAFVTLLNREMTSVTLMEELSVERDELHSVMKPLVDAGLVAHKVRGLQDAFDYDRTYYTATDYGKRVIRALFDSKCFPSHRERRDGE